MFGYAEREIMTYGHCEILRLPPQYEMKFAHIREANISHAAGVFHISQKYFTCPQGQISLKKALLSQCFFLVGAGGFGPPKSVTTDLQSAPFGRSGTLPYSFVPALLRQRMIL